MSTRAKAAPTPAADVGEASDAEPEAIDDRCREAVDNGTSGVGTGQRDAGSGVVLADESWIDRLTADEFATLDDFDQQMVRDELESRGNRLAKVTREASIAMAGALLVASASQADTARAHANGIAEGVAKSAARPARRSGSLEDSLGPLLDHPLVVGVLDRVAALVAERVSGGNDNDYYKTSENPLKSSRAFRDAARRGDFPSFKLGREIAAKKTDVHAWIESRSKRLKIKKAKPKSSDDGMLAEFGLRATRKHGAEDE